MDLTASTYIIKVELPYSDKDQVQIALEEKKSLHISLKKSNIQPF